MSGYSLKEKIYICENYIIPNILKRHGLRSNVLRFEDDSIVKIINDYTNEAGVRELERCISKIIRKVITEHIKSARKIISVRIKPEDLEHYLERELYNESGANSISHTGVVKAVACNSLGGVTLNIECSAYKGKGNFTFTGSLGDVTRESISVAISYIRSNAEKFDIPNEFFEDNDLHIHFTEAGVSKDGPSAGSSIITVILSLIKDRIIPNNISMTGEVSLKGDILKVGGIKEKTIAAKKNNINKIYIPKDNLNDVKWLDSDLKDGMDFIPVSNYEDIYKEIFS